VSRNEDKNNHVEKGYKLEVVKILVSGFDSCILYLSFSYST